MLRHAQHLCVFKTACILHAQTCKVCNCACAKVFRYHNLYTGTVAVVHVFHLSELFFWQLVQWGSDNRGCTVPTKSSAKSKPPQCFFQDLGQGGAKRQYVIWWGGMALNMHSTCQFQGGARVSLGGANAPPAPP